MDVIFFVSLIRASHKPCLPLGRELQPRPILLTVKEDERHLALYVKDVVDDPDAEDGTVFNRWLADCDTRGEAVDWEGLL